MENKTEKRVNAKIVKIGAFIFISIIILLTIILVGIINNKKNINANVSNNNEYKENNESQKEEKIDNEKKEVQDDTSISDKKESVKEENKSEQVSQNNFSGDEKVITSNVEYKIEKYNTSDYVIIGKNLNEKVNNIEFEVEFYDSNNSFLGSSSADLDACVKNTEFAIDLYNVPKSFDHYEVNIDLDETDNKSYADKLECNSNKTDDKVVGQIKNTTDSEIEYIEVSIIYIKNNQIVGYEDTLLSDIKSGRNANFEFDLPYDDSYDDIDFDNYNIYINSAYTYTW